MRLVTNGCPPTSAGDSIMDTHSTISAHRTAVFTIVSRNYLHYARVLMRSLQAVSPQWDRFVLLADLIDGAFDPASEPFEVIEARTLPIPEAEKFFFRYTILEANTAVKPWFFRHLFAKGYERVIYLDPDIFVYSPMREVEHAFDEGALAVLVPHLTGRILDSARPGEHEVLQSGAYNLGFCAMARHPELEALLDFWCEKSLRDFVVDLPRGLFTDQRWIDLVPGMFSDVTILRHEGYDVAYWNLAHRRLVPTAGGILVNGVPLVFFHFSGIDPLNPEAFSKHQNRYRLATIGPAADLASHYCAAVRVNGLRTCRDLAYAYGFLHDGSPIPDILRRLYRTTPEVEDWAGDNPFARSCTEWNQPLDAEWPPLTRVMLAVYQARPDIRLTWPDAVGADREAFARWFVDTSELQHIVPACYVQPVRQVLEDVRQPIDVRSRRPQVKVRADLVGGALRKARIALSEGRLPLSPRRWLHLFRLHASEEAQREVMQSSPELPPVKWPPTAKPKRAALSCIGFHEQSAEEASAGVAWMGRSGSLSIEGRPGARVTVRGEHMASAHLRARGTVAVTLHAELDGILLAQQAVQSDGPFELAFTLPVLARGSPLALHATDVFVPSHSGIGADARELSVQVKWVEVDGYRLLDFGRPGACFQPKQQVAAAPELTIVGYVSQATGVAAGAHASAAACKEAGISCELIDALPLAPVRGQYSISLLHVNADQTQIVARALGENFFRDRYTIGMWAWELEELPDVFLEAFDWLDEVWAVSRFVQEAVAEKSPVPVVHMPHSVTAKSTTGLSRREFGIPENRFLFLMMYDALSVQERKNPLGALEAFRRAFRDRSRVGLVIKVNHAASRPEDVALVRRQVADTEGALLIDRPMSREDAHALQASCDAFVSLHRSEGFGLNIAEAMFLGKPVVATGYSGNLDFTTSQNACLVDHELVTLADHHGPYRRGNRWAEPDKDHAAGHMVRLVEDREFRERIAASGQRTIRDEFSPAAIGLRYRKRLAAIRRMM